MSNPNPDEIIKSGPAQDAAIKQVAEMNEDEPFPDQERLEEIVARGREEAALGYLIKNPFPRAREPYDAGDDCYDSISEAVWAAENHKRKDFWIVRVEGGKYRIEKKPDKVVEVQAAKAAATTKSKETHQSSKPRLGKDEWPATIVMAISKSPAWRETLAQAQTTTIEKIKTGKIPFREGSKREIIHSGLTAGMTGEALMAATSWNKQMVIANIAEVAYLVQREVVYENGLYHYAKKVGEDAK